MVVAPVGAGRADPSVALAVEREPADALVVVVVLAGILPPAGSAGTDDAIAAVVEDVVAAAASPSDSDTATAEVSLVPVRVNMLALEIITIKSINNKPCASTGS